MGLIEMVLRAEPAAVSSSDPTNGRAPRNAPGTAPPSGYARKVTQLNPLSRAAPAEWTGPHLPATSNQVPTPIATNPTTLIPTPNSGRLNAVTTPPISPASPQPQEPGRKHCAGDAGPSPCRSIWAKAGSSPCRERSISSSLRCSYSESAISPSPSREQTAAPAPILRVGRDPHPRSRCPLAPPSTRCRSNLPTTTTDRRSGRQGPRLRRIKPGIPDYPRRRAAQLRPDTIWFVAFVEEPPVPDQMYSVWARCVSLTCSSRRSWMPLLSPGCADRVSSGRKSRRRSSGVASQCDNDFRPEMQGRRVRRS